jgi:hypothetical protein
MQIQMVPNNLENISLPGREFQGPYLAMLLIAHRLCLR